MDMKLEVVTIAVSDVEKSTQFYRALGWRQDVTPPGVVQLTPPGSACSVQFGPDRTSAAPGSAEGIVLVVTDIEATHKELTSAGVEVTRVFHQGPDGPVPGPDPQRRSYTSFCSVADPDGNRWLFQEVTTRLPGRMEGAATSFASQDDLAGALRRAEAAHGEHEKRTGVADPNWPDWYADYLVREQAGAELPT